MKVEKIILGIFTIIFFGCQANSNDLIFERNYLKGLELSSKMNKPVFIHFTGYGSIGYNEFVYDLITSKEIQEKLNNDFVTVQLYVDDPKPIETNDTLNLHKIDFSKEGQRRIKKATKNGHINTAIQIEKFGRNSQPLYVILDKAGNNIIEPFNYTGKDRKLFLTKLEEGLKEYKNKSRRE